MLNAGAGVQHGFQIIGGLRRKGGRKAWAIKVQGDVAFGQVGFDRVEDKGIGSLKRVGSVDFDKLFVIVDFDHHGNGGVPDFA